MGLRGCELLNGVPAVGPTATCTEFMRSTAGFRAVNSDGLSGVSPHCESALIL